VHLPEELHKTCEENLSRSLRALHMAFSADRHNFVKNSISSWTYNTANADSYGDAMPDNTTFITISATAPFSKSGSYLANYGPNGNAILGVYQQLSTRNGGEVVSADAY
jgi:hypothetical protein